MENETELLDSAASCFLRFGYAETSMDEIVSESGAVKQTFYNRFSNKESLFRSCVEHIIKQMPSQDLLHSWFKLSPLDFFQKLGRVHLRTFSRQENLAFLRLLVKESRRFPELQEVYAKALPEPFVEYLADYLCKEFSHDPQSARSLAWAFRAVLSAYASLSNLSRLLPEPIPSKSEFLFLSGEIFQKICSDKSINARLSQAINQQDQVNSDLNLDLFSREDFSQFLRGAGEKLADKQLEIIYAGFKLFCLRGFADTSMDEICLQAKVSKATLYKYFKNKNQLFSFLFSSIFSALLAGSKDRYWAATQTKNSSFASNYLDSALRKSNPFWLREYFRMVFGEAAAFPSEAAKALLYLFLSGQKQFEAGLTAANPEACQKEKLALIASCLLGAYVLFSQIYLIGKLPYFNEKVLLVILEALYEEGLSGDQSESPD